MADPRPLGPRVDRDGGPLMGTTPYGARPIRRRATAEEMAERRQAVAQIVMTDGPMSIRHAYYRAVVNGLVKKNENGYRMVQRAVLDLRRDGTIPYHLIVDNTRLMRKPATWDSLEEMLADAARYYRRDLWAQSGWRLEVWCESDSISGTIADVTERWDIPLMVTRGFSSETFAFAAAETWADDRRRIPVVLYIGDLDPAGVEIEKNLRAKLTAFYADLTGFEDSVLWTRVGIEMFQVVELDLYNAGTVPKKAYGYPLAWEAEALPAPYLREQLEAEIESRVDQEALAAIKAAEESEREVLIEIAATARGRS